MSWMSSLLIFYVIPLDPPRIEYQEMQWRLPVRYAINKTNDRHPRKEKKKKKRSQRNCNSFSIEYFFFSVSCSGFCVTAFSNSPCNLKRCTWRSYSHLANIYTVVCVYIVQRLAASSFLLLIGAFIEKISSLRRASLPPKRRKTKNPNNRHDDIRSYRY